jgi:hypothetical protein
MAVQFENYTHSFELKGKPVFAPSERGRRIGNDIKQKVEAAAIFDDFFHHLQPGGHVSALHAHRENRYFARVDIERFFYGIGRNRVARALRELGIERATHYAKWSCVKNPYDDPSYALPYGFVQSPILATLVLALSPVGAFLRALSRELTVSVYMDDISLSSADKERLQFRFEELCSLMQRSGFALNAAKRRAPAQALDVFNCNLTGGRTQVLESRVAEFFSFARTEPSEASFLRYCAAVEAGNAEPLSL